MSDVPPDAMTDDHLIEHKTGSLELFKGRFLHAFRDTVRLPDGSADHARIHRASRRRDDDPDAGRRPAGAGAAVPLPDGRVMIEFPAGKLDPGEDPLACARRELLEETGYSAARVGARRA